MNRRRSFGIVLGVNIGGSFALKDDSLSKLPVLA